MATTKVFFEDNNAPAIIADSVSMTIVVEVDGKTLKYRLAATDEGLILEEVITNGYGVCLVQSLYEDHEDFVEEEA